MVRVPDRLLDLPFVRVFHRSQHLVVLGKSLDTALENRESYVAMHAISIPRVGHQLIEPHEGNLLRIGSRQVAFVRKGLYTITDMLAAGEGFQSMHIFFDDSLLDQILNRYPIRPENIQNEAIFTISAPDYLDHYLESFEKIHQEFPSAKPALFEIKIAEFLAILISDHASSGFLERLHGFKHRDQGNLKSFMQKHFNKALTIDDFAYLTGRSVPTFRREFKIKFGTSPRQWIIQQRLEKAKDLLENGSISVQDVANQVGYDSTSHFIKAFKKAFGITPKQKQSISQTPI